MAYDAVQNVDVLFRGTGVPLLPTVILDYIYGVSAYQAWRSKRGDGFDQMKAYRKHYAQIPPPPPPSSPDDTDVTLEPDDRNNADYKPPKPQKHHRSTRRSGL